jgi:hypothetical protein
MLSPLPALTIKPNLLHNTEPKLQMLMMLFPTQHQTKTAPELIIG